MYILHIKENLKKKLAKANKVILVRYSITSRAYRVHNKKSLKNKEFANVTFDKTMKTYPKNP